MTPHSVNLFNIDCIKHMHSLPDDCFDLIVTDPPYSSGGLHATTRKQPPSRKYLGNDCRRPVHDFAHDNKDQRSWTRWCVDWLTESRRVLKPGGLVCVFIDWRQLPALTDAIQMAGYLWQGVAVWDKTVGGCRPRNGGMRQQAEFIVWASHGPLRASGTYLPGVFHGRKPTDTFHITAKPVPIMADLCQLAGQHGHVFDPFAGGGAVLKAAQQLGISATGCEIEPEIHRQALADLELPSLAA